MFWDSSAIIPLCLDEPMSATVRDLHAGDGDMAAWWGTSVECRSVFARLAREPGSKFKGTRRAAESLEDLAKTWLEILPSERVRETAIRLLSVHPLRAADSLQLAAALVWSGIPPRGHVVTCLDRRLRKAATLEGFTVLPEELPGEE
jgi:predicted nucleic acid-binding protein